MRVTLVFINICFFFSSNYNCRLLGGQPCNGYFTAKIAVEKLGYHGSNGLSTTGLKIGNR